MTLKQPAARRILFYTAALGGGGAEIAFRRLAEGFAARGAIVMVCADREGGPAPADATRVHTRLFGTGHIRSTLRLARLLREFAPDASLSALGAQNLKHVVAAALAGRLNRCFLGIHGYAVAEPRLLSRLSYHLLPLTSRMTAGTICVSDGLTREVANRWRAARAKLHRINNPLPRRAALPDPAGASEQPPLILALGRLEAIKRFDDLVAALALMARGDAKLAILGTGPARDAIQAAIESHGLTGRVTLPGFVAEPASWFAKAAVVAITSTSESFGLTAAEALAHGLPVVCTDCGGPPEIVGATEGCHVVPVGDVVALAAALDRALRDPGDAQARRARSQLFALDRICADYAALIEATVPPSPASRR